MLFEKAPKILIADDDVVLTKGLELKFKSEGYEVFTVVSAKACVDLAVRHNPHLILLDQMLKDGVGLDVCRELRRKGIASIIIFVSVKGQETDRIVGLEVGADDYITKPFSLGELLARVRAHLRRFSEHDSGELPVYRFGTIEVDFKKLRATRKNKAVDLTAKEFELLRLMVQHRGEVLTRDFILDAVWGYDSSSNTRTVDTHVARLRQKLDSPADPQFIASVYGEGYRFVD
jgi:two-component system, OmpR family, alkaline phosphatase synthesis response regulator PhoP